MVYISKWFCLCNSLQFCCPSCSRCSNCILHLSMSVSSFIPGSKSLSLHIYFWCLSLSLHANITSPCFLITFAPYNTAHFWVSCASASNHWFQLSLIPVPQLIYSLSTGFELWRLISAYDLLGVSPESQGSQSGWAVRRIQPWHQRVDRRHPLLPYEGGLCRYWPYWPKWTNFTQLTLKSVFYCEWYGGHLF